VNLVEKTISPDPNTDKANQLLHKASEDFHQLLANCTLSDVTLVVGDKELEAHKNILGARSPVFAAMFEHDFKEKNENRVNIDDVPLNVFEELLRYIYSGKVVDMDKYATGLLAASDKVRYL